MRLVGAVAVIAWGDWLNRRWSRMLARPDDGVGTEAVVVLGFRNRRARLNAVNRSRVRAGVRTAGDDTVLICSGGGPAGRPAEARLMADYARSALGFPGRIVVEAESRSTWENVTNVIALLEDVDRIKIVSQPAHALKARVYLHRQRPDLAGRLVRTYDRRAGGGLVGAPVLAVFGLWTLRRITRSR